MLNFIFYLQFPYLVLTCCFEDSGMHVQGVHTFLDLLGLITILNFQNQCPWLVWKTIIIINLVISMHKRLEEKKSELIFCKIFLALVGISQSARGYCMISVLETMKTYSLEDGLTEEALVTKLRTCQYHHLFLHTSLRHNSSGLHFLTFEALTTFLK